MMLLRHASAEAGCYHLVVVRTLLTAHVLMPIQCHLSTRAGPCAIDLAPSAEADDEVLYYGRTTFCYAN